MSKVSQRKRRSQERRWDAMLSPEDLRATQEARQHFAQRHIEERGAGEVSVKRHRQGKGADNTPIWPPLSKSSRPDGRPG